MSRGYRFFAPEIIQTSAIDCGVAALKSFLEAFGLDCSYERLREACQTDVDGTSIDTIEELCTELGIDVVQHLVPEEFFFDACLPRLPAIAVLRRPSGAAHFVVVWNVVGDFVQIMDPASGRKWQRKATFEDELYQHTQAFNPEDFNAWFRNSSFAEALSSNAQRLAGPVIGSQLVASAGNWKHVAALDIAARLLGKATGPKSGNARVGGPLLEQLVARAYDDLDRSEKQMPPKLWSIQASEASIDLKGVVFLASQRPERPKPAQRIGELPSRAARAVSTTLTRPPATAFSELIDFIFTEPALCLALIFGTIFLCLGSLFEFFLFRAGLSLSSGIFDSKDQRILLPLGLLAYFVTMLVMEAAILRGVHRLGRLFEASMRLRISTKIAQLGERYVQSRPVTDLADRAHNIYTVQSLPRLAFLGGRSLLDLIFTASAICILDLRVGLVALAGVFITIFALFSLNILLSEVDLRFQTQTGGLFNVFLDALLGAVPVRTHGMAPAMRVEQEGLLVSWLKTGQTRLGLSASSSTLAAFLTTALAVAIVTVFVAKSTDQRALVLLILWVLRVPGQTQMMATAIQLYPLIRNSVLRVVEPLRIGEIDQPIPPPVTQPSNVVAISRDSLPAREEFSVARGGIRLDLRSITVMAGGHEVLKDINVRFEAGEHVAIVGRSGAGKSTLLTLPLGINTPDQGVIEADGAPLDATRIATLRQFTAWLDPAVQIWNRSLFHNIRCGTFQEVTRPLSRVLSDSDLMEVLERLEFGLSTKLGSAGSRLSGGEGQRVRLARALFRAQSRLVILDEPFRGLDRATRARLLTRTREIVGGATLLCATHDVRRTVDFPRVIVIDGGRIVEDGHPRVLYERGGAYHTLLKADAATDEAIWNRQWTRLRLDGGSLVEEDDAVA